MINRLIRLLLVAGILALVACGDNTLAALTETHSDQANSTEDAAATKSSSKAKDTPEVRNMLAAFAKQAHRIEFNGCEMLYNGKPFELGMTIKELVDIFGPYDLFNRGFYVWKAAGIVFVVESNDENVNHITNYIYVYFNAFGNDYRNDKKLKHMLYRKKDYLLWEGVPIDKNMKVKDFFAYSKFDIDSFSVSDSAYELTYHCDTLRRSKVYRIRTEGNWIYKGTGHLQLKSHVNPDNESYIELMFVDFVGN